MEPVRAPSSSTADAVSRARAAFAVNTTISGHKWRQQQLYGLCELLTQHGRELVQYLSEEQPSWKAQYEQELAVVLGDIARHYIHAAGPTVPVHAAVVKQILPVGVSVLLVDGANPIRFLFSSLAANIAVGNTVILTRNTRKLDRFWGILQREAPKHLDPEAIQVVQSLDLDHAVLDKVDLVTIFAENSEPFNDILQLPNTQFICTRAGASLVVVDEGSKSYDQISRDIVRSYSFRKVRPEAVGAVFIRQAESDEFRKSFNALSSPAAPSASTPQTKLFAQFSSYSYLVDLAKLIGSGKKELTLSKAIESAAREGVLLVISYRSIDHVIDALRQLSPAPTYLTLLAPKNTANSEYFKNWTTSRFFSLGYIRPVFPYESVSDVLFPQSLFGRARTSFVGQQAGIEQPLAEVLRSVHKIVQPPKEAPNQTVDFFIYMSRVATGIGLSLGVLSVMGMYRWYTRTTS